MSYNPIWTSGRIANKTESPRGPTLREYRDAQIALDILLDMWAYVDATSAPYVFQDVRMLTVEAFRGV